MGGTAGKNGLWQSVIEKAWQQTRPDNPTDAMNGGRKYYQDSGDHISKGIEVLTGNPARTVELGTQSNVEQTRETLRSALGEKRLVTAGGANNAAAAEDGLKDHHAYTVLGYDEKSDKVKLRNPWGKGERGPNGGLSVKSAHDGKNDGTFEVSLQEFHEDFGYMAVEEPPAGRA